MLRLRGPTGIIVANGWVQAYVIGLPVCGLVSHLANRYEDGGRTWIYQTAYRNWGPEAAEAIIHGVCYVYDRSL